MNYGELAQKLSNQRLHDRCVLEAGMQQKAPLADIYKRVQLHVNAEIEKANGEMRKQKLDTIERIYMPSHRGKLCLTFGSELLCTVEPQDLKGQIAAVISGPPNAKEISRKEFPLTAGCDPERIAVDIVSGLLMGEFS